MKKWLQWTPDRNGIVSVVVTFLMLVVVFALAVIYFPFSRQQNPRAGFGPEWDCVAQIKGDPICVKKPIR